MSNENLSNMPDELKAKLRETLSAQFEVEDDPNCQCGHFEEDIERAIDQIDQAYKNAGYKSGREWYKDFARELGKQGFVSTGNAAHDISAWVDEAAKRASGME